MKLGDAIEKAARALGFETCDKCKKRRDALNRLDDKARGKLRGKKKGGR